MHHGPGGGAKKDNVAPADLIGGARLDEDAVSRPQYRGHAVRRDAAPHAPASGEQLVAQFLEHPIGGWAHRRAALGLRGPWPSRGLGWRSCPSQRLGQDRRNRRSRFPGRVLEPVGHVAPSDRGSRMLRLMTCPMAHPIATTAVSGVVPDAFNDWGGSLGMVVAALCPAHLVAFWGCTEGQRLKSSLPYQERRLASYSHSKMYGCSTMVCPGAALGETGRPAAPLLGGGCRRGAGHCLGPTTGRPLPTRLAAAQPEHRI